MVYESGYESGRTPFQPDMTRGVWATPSDFVYTGLALAFKVDLFLTPYMFTNQFGIMAILPHLLCLAVFVVPVLMLQVFMGQFSSSGFISAFRITPIFKGLGYVSLVVNIFALSFYSIFAAIPLLFFLNSFRPTLPWSCEAFKTWTWQNETMPENICFTNVSVPKEVPKDDTVNPYYALRVPSVLWFRSLFSQENNDDELDSAFQLSWELTICNLIIWTVIAVVFYYCFHPAKIAKLVRYALWYILGVLLICLIRFVFLPGAEAALRDFFAPAFNQQIWYQLEIVPMQAMSAFGVGSGTLICLSSFNKFRTDIVRCSWLVALGQMLIFMFLGLTTSLVAAHFEQYVIEKDEIFGYVDNRWNLYISSASAIATLELPNLWSMLYYAMLMAGITVLLIIQIYTILVSIFDDFVNLRAHKPQVTFGCIGILALSSIYFCSTHGVKFCVAFSIDALFLQIIIYLMLLLVVLWIYGRERFQRDFEFMLGKPIATWRIYLLRFASPLYLLLLLLLTYGASVFFHFFTKKSMQTFCAIITSSVWIFLPAYCIFMMLQSNGTIRERFKRCCRPMDWYPVDAEERQRYEEAMGNMDMTHQLKEVGDEIL